MIAYETVLGSQNPARGARGVVAPAYNALIERLIETGADELADPEVVKVASEPTETANEPAAA